MVIRVPRTALQQDPTTSLSAQRVVPVQAISNPAAAPTAATSAAAGLAAQILQEDRDRTIETKTLELDIARRKADQQVVNGYLQLQGKGAVDARDAAMAAITRNSKRLSAGIKDAAVANAWRNQDVALTNAAINQLDGHFRQQNVRWRADTLSDRADLLIQDLGRVAFGNGYQPGAGLLSGEAERTRSGFHDTIGELGAVLGWSPEQVEKNRRAADTQAYGQVAQSLIDGDRFDEAAAVLTRYGVRIEVGRRDHLAALARDGKLRTAAALALQQRADKANAFTLHAADQAAARGGSLAEQRAYAFDIAEYSFRGKKLTGQDYDDVLTRLDRHYKQADAREDAAVNQAFAAAQSALLEQQDLDPMQLDRRLLRVLTEHGKLEPLIAFANDKRFVNRGGALQRLPELWDSGELAKMSAAKFEREFRGSLEPQTFERWDARRATLRNEATSKQLHVRSLENDLEALLVDAKVIGLKEQDVTKLQRKERFITAIQAEIDAQKITERAKVLAIAKERLATKLYKSEGWDEELPEVTMTADELKTAYVITPDGRKRTVAGLQELPPDVLQTIDAQLRQKGVEPTDPSRLLHYAQVIEPWQNTMRFLSELPADLQRAAHDQVRSTGGNVNDPFQVERAVRAEQGQVGVLREWGRVMEYVGGDPAKARDFLQDTGPFADPFVNLSHRRMKTPQHFQELLRYAEEQARLNGAR